MIVVSHNIDKNITAKLERLLVVLFDLRHMLKARFASGFFCLLKSELILYVKRLFLISVCKYSLLTELKAVDVIRIKELLLNGRTQQSIANEYDVHRTNISAIAIGRSWKSLLD